MAECREIKHRDIHNKQFVGNGSFGAVYKANWRNKSVAIKSSNNSEDEDSIETEIELLSQMNHPNIIKFYGYCMKPLALVLEFAEDGSLYDALHKKKKTKFSYELLTDWALQCAKGVQYLHSFDPPILHRDLKSPNLLLMRDYQVLKICDFGIARNLDVLMTGKVGSLAWMAPELLKGRRNYNEKCDVYSFGIILWEMFTREIPFAGYNALSIMRSVIEGGRPSGRRRCPDHIRAVYTRCWAQHASERPRMRRVAGLLKEFGDDDIELQFDGLHLH